ncbi:MAG TPA: rod shape-determining protein RodA [Candidatus Moranbacteria bacterium]|nr:rod shape-determining protein RodA [Candidatus Moranbacteria bacterium]
MKKYFFQLKELDFIALLPIVVLLGFSLMTIYALSQGLATGDFSNFEKQVLFIFLGALVFLGFFLIDYRIWLGYSGILYLLGVLLMLAVLFWGVTIRNTSGWFVVGPFSLQPAEAMKFFLIISLASYFHKQATSGVTWKEIIISFVYVSVPSFLAIQQPDMGSVLVMVAIWGVMIFVAGLNWKQIATLFLVGVGILFLSWTFLLHDYQKKRLESFLEPQRDPQGSGYNVIQSMVAVGAGGARGQGLGAGSQSQLNFLPEKHNDFIFASIAEQSGFLGTSLIFLMLGLLFWRIKRAVDFAANNFGKLLATGVLTFLFFQTFINIGMNIGVVPVAGISLPLVSYGGSFLLITLASLGLVQSVRRISSQHKSHF